MSQLSATIDYTQARTQLPQMPERLRKEKVIWVNKHGKKAFALVEPEIMEMYLETMEILRDPSAFKMLQQSIEDIRHGRLRNHDDVRRELLDDESPRHHSVD